MPFDGAEYPNLEVLGKLEATRELLSDQQRWCQGLLVNVAGQMCLLAALRRSGAGNELTSLVLTAAREVTGRSFRSIERFNDHKTTTHVIVLQVLDRTRDGLVSGRYVTDGNPGVLARCRDVCRNLAARAGLGR